MDSLSQRVIACVIQRGDELLVCQRPPHKRHGGLWEFPGGKVHEGESDGQAAARELREELEVELAEASPVLFEVRDGGSPFLIAFVRVTITGDPRPTEHTAVKWGTTKQLIEMPLAPSDRAFVKFILGRPKKAPYE